MSALVKLTQDRHQQALYRLAMEQVREAQRIIDLAIKHGQRTRRECLGGQIELVEQAGWLS